MAASSVCSEEPWYKSSYNQPNNLDMDHLDGDDCYDGLLGVKKLTKVGVKVGGVEFLSDLYI